MAKVWEVLQEFSSKPFDWNGEADCCIFASRLVEVIHGIDYMKDFRYGSKAEALRVILKHGNLVDAITSVMGPPREVDPDDLQPGDVLICKQVDKSWIPGVLISDRIAVRTENGVMDWPIEYARHMWRPGQCHEL